MKWIITAAASFVLAGILPQSAQGTVVTSPPSGVVAKRCQAVERTALRLSEAADVDPALVMGIMRVESGYRAAVRSSVVT